MQRYIWAVISGAFIAAAMASAQAQPDFDVLIRNGRVMDGTGNPWLRADIGIRGDRIAAIGRLAESRARRVVDAADRLVTPGFIDVHSHAAEGLSREPLRQAQPLLAQGVTTVVVNPDGGGPVDLAAQRSRFEADRLGVNVALLIGHGSVRRAVMNSANRAPTAEELDRMRALVRRGMSEGAFGLSSGLFYTPGSFANDRGGDCARQGDRRSSVASTRATCAMKATTAPALIASVDEVIRIAEEAGVIGIVTHMKALGPDSWGLSAAATARIEDARRAGRAGLRRSVSLRGVVHEPARGAPAGRRRADRTDRPGQPEAAGRAAVDSDRVVPAGPVARG